LLEYGTMSKNKTMIKNKILKLTNGIHAFFLVLLVEVVAVAQFTVQWLAWTLIYPTLEASIKWPALLPNRINSLFLSNFVIVFKVIIKMSFQLLISDESLSTITTLKLDPKENLINSNDVLSKNGRKKNEDR
jgi:hypothetical protein